MASGVFGALDRRCCPGRGWRGRNRASRGGLRDGVGVAVAYTETDSLALYGGILDSAFAPAPDLLISSASDLQLKLANDGHALVHQPPHLDDLPTWAQWRREVIGFTYEPVVIIYNPELVPPGTGPGGVGLPGAAGRNAVRADPVMLVA